MRNNQPRFPKTLLALAAVFIISLAGVPPIHGLAAQPDAGPTPAALRVRSDLPIDQIIVKYRATSSARLHPASLAQMQRISQAAGVSLRYRRAMSGGAHVLRLPAGLPLARVQAIVARLMASPDVQYAVPDRHVSLAGFPAVLPARPAMLSPNDTDYASQWNLSGSWGINAPAAWDVTTGSSSVVVAVLDTGFTSHAELSGRSVTGYDFVTNPLYANDGDGRDADASDPGDWITTAENDGTTDSGFYLNCGVHDSTWHGTHVAGIIGANANNSQGVAGIDWAAKLEPVRVVGKCGGDESDLIDGISWAAGLAVSGAPTNLNPAKVLNLSLTIPLAACDTALQTAIDNANTAGAVVVVAAGNYHYDLNSYNFAPADCANVINVAGTGPSGDMGFYSNYGSSVTISAPGGDQGNLSDGIFSTLDTGLQGPAGDGYGYQMGTSEAAPHVSGVVSLLFSLDAGLTPAQVRQILQRSARAFPNGAVCTTSTCGAGILDADEAIKVLQDATPPDTSIDSQPSDPDNDTTPTFTFSGSDGSGSGIGSFQCKFDAGSYAACTSPFTPSTLSDGAHTFYVRATDRAGNTDASPASYTWTVDGTAPSVSIDSHPAASDNHTTPSFDFSADDGTGTGVASFQCKMDTGSYGACTSPYTSSTLSDGTHTFYVQATDNAGNIGLASFTWTLDTVAPDTSLGTTHPSNPDNDNTPTFDFSGSDADTGVASFQCSIDSGSYATCTSPYTSSVLADGLRTFHVAAVDQAGNIDSDPAVFVWRVDTIAPVVSIDSHPANVDADTTPSFAFSATDINGSGVVTSSYQCKIDGGSYAACTSPFTASSLADGSHTFYAQATDNAANTGSASYTWIVDTAAPIVLSSALADPNPTSLSSVHFTVTFSEPVTGVDSADFNLVPSGVSAAALSGVSGSGAVYTVTVNTGSGNGSIRLDVLNNGTILDLAGNPLSASYGSGPSYTVNKPVTLSLSSNASQDGWVLESSETSNTGGSLNSTAGTLVLGDDAANRQYRVILSFNTAVLPPTAHIQSAQLKIRQSGAPVGTNPFNVLGALWADIRKGVFGSSASLALTDFNATASATRVGSFNKTPVAGWYTDNLSAAGLARINLLGSTQFRLYFAKDDNNNHVADFMRFVSGSGPASQRPLLVITYTLP